MCGNWIISSSFINYSSISLKTHHIEDIYIYSCECACTISMRNTLERPVNDERG